MQKTQNISIITHIMQKIELLLDGSLFFRGILAFFNAVIRFFQGSFIVRLFVDDFDEKRLENSRFVGFVEYLLNRFPKISHNTDYPASLPRLLQGSRLITFFTAAMNTPLVGNPLKWLVAAFPVWGLLAIVAVAPFFPTMLLAGMIVLVFGAALFVYKFKLDITATALFFYILVTFAMAYGSLAPASSIPIAFLTTAIMLSYVLVYTCFNTRKCLDVVMAVFISVAAVTAFIAFYQIIIGYVNMTWVDRDLFAALSLRVYSTFGNPNVYGAYLLLAIPLAAGLILYVKNPLYKVYATGVTGVLVVALALTYSRGCYLALAGAVLFFMLLVEKRLIVLYGLGLAVAPILLPDHIIARLVSILNFADTSTAFRISIWQASIRILQDFWMAGLGQGIEAYNMAYPFYSFAAVPAPHAHNLFLQVFLETGIIGLLAFLAVLACFFRTQFSFMRNTQDSRRKLLSAAITAGVVGFLFQGMFDHVFYNYRVMLAFFLFLGIGTALVKVDNEGTQP
ncbi:MAG: O-antigen ligase family protein [Defluviitaleaceae bacterium]|nr:O-antigen ligase family protein [Defluviitaleaceae bacterium]